VKISQNALMSCLAEYREHIKLGNNETITFVLRPLSAIQRVGLLALWLQNPAEAQRKTWEECVVGWEGIEDSDTCQPILFNIENLIRLATIVPDLAKNLNDHLAKRNNIFASQDEQTIEGEEKEKANFTRPANG